MVIIRNSELLAGTLDKSTLGSGSKNNIYLIVLRKDSSQAAIDAMWRLCRLVPFFLSNRGFSMGISDVYPSAQLTAQKNELVKTGYTSRPTNCLRSVASLYIAYRRLPYPTLVLHNLILTRLLNDVT